MILHILDGGTIDIRDWSAFDPSAPPGRSRSLSDPCFLIVHENGVLLWDTGLPDSARSRPDGMPVGDRAVFHVERALRDELADLGFTPDDVDLVGLSHLHRDHVGNLALFGNATLLVQDDELEVATGPRANAMGYDPQACIAAVAMKKVQLHGDHDVFGDGSVVVLRFPGHTIGSQALLVRLSETGPVLLSGDLAHSRANWRSRAVPALNMDAERTVASLEAADRLAVSEGAQIWVQHDRAQMEALRRTAPFR
ncbi:N-acyl homoserine lactonase family protein [Nocardia sp. NPDC051787]|uniref:N-acyl homoserine lactonase family protein n=1 Tax=Nocardia sp. NPDC051787 TaxID=3155415 RepID=UPI003433F241